MCIRDSRNELQPVFHSCQTKTAAVFLVFSGKLFRSLPDVPRLRAEDLGNAFRFHAVPGGEEDRFQRRADLIDSYHLFFRIRERTAHIVISFFPADADMPVGAELQHGQKRCNQLAEMCIRDRHCTGPFR